MELYLVPTEGLSTAAVSRAAVLSALSASGFVVGSESADVRPDGLVFWRLKLAGVDLSVDFQERDGLVTFGTLHVSMFDVTGVGDRFCSALQAVGWEIDEESFG